MKERRWWNHTAARSRWKPVRCGIAFYPQSSGDRQSSMWNSWTITAKRWCTYNVAVLALSIGISTGGQNLIP